MKDKNKNIAIGFVTFTAIGLFVWMLLFLHPSVGDGKNALRVRFTEIDKIAVGSRVTFAGQPVGLVKQIALVPDARALEGDEIFAYELLLSIDSKVQIFPYDAVTVKTAGLMGEKTIAITPKRVKYTSCLPLNNNDILYATNKGSVEDTLQSIAAAAEKLETAVDSIHTFEQSATEATKSFSAASNELALFLKTCNQAELVPSMAASSRKLDSILTEIAAGRGTLGKLIYNDELHHKTVQLATKTDVLLNNLNNYGVMYQWNNKWKNEQGARATTLAQLSSPQAVHGFVSEEVNKLSTTICRIELALEKLKMESKNLPKEESDEAYNSLLEEVRNLENTINIYKELSKQEYGYIVDTSSK